MARKNLLFACLSAGLLFTGAVQSAHALLSYDFTTIHSSSGTPGGPAPWATLTIANNGLGGVNMTLAHNASSASGQFITELNLLASSLGTGSSYTSPKITGISFGGYTDA
ncbi:MAG: hypothetical protein KIT45_13145, partial [Fimbriimonadia bacterium]|nr:hypothetical protein [Fimbriimonadia bacterium]